MIPISQPPVIMVELAAAEKRQIGDARMEPDGTIILRIRFEQGSTVGDGEYRYISGTSGYEYVRAHLPHLKPGQNVPIYNDWPFEQRGHQRRKWNHQPVPRLVSGGAACGARGWVPASPDSRRSVG